MKQIGCAMILVAFLSICFLAACGDRKESAKSEIGVTSEDVKKEAAEAVETTMAYTEHQKEKYQKQIEAKFEEYDQKIDELKVRAEGLQGEAKEELRQKIEELRKRRDATYNTLDELKSASGRAWDDMKSGMDTAMDELDEAYERALSRFR
jgi:ABC-type glycerol-3-phosphate transport system substrate-binding protein